MATASVTLVAALYLHPGREREFEEFETAAAEIMRRYGGAIERRIRIAAAADQDRPYEVHIVAFPDDRSFQQYRADPDLQALAGLRATAIRETVVWSGKDLPDFAG
jgi:antibiotic biosynthesis monooxygenase (ABM) superfamily enzyme